jgi:hypothetical protein
MARYNHAYTIAFEIESNKEDASDVTADMIRRSLEKRLSDGDLEIVQAAGSPFDTYPIA